MVRHAARSALAALLAASLAHGQRTIDPPVLSTSELGDVIRATGDYWKKTQIARLLREEARQKELETAGKRIEFEMWWDAVRPTGAKMTARERAAELERARTGPSNADVSSGRAANVLLASVLMAGERGPTVPLSDAARKSITLKSPAAAGSAALFKTGVKLDWPLSLDTKATAKERARLARNLRLAVSSVKSGDKVPNPVLRELQSDWTALDAKLSGSAARLTPASYGEGRRYLAELNSAIKALSGPDGTKEYGKSRTPGAKTVGDLVRHMGREGLVFAPAKPGDEAGYRALYLALRKYEERVVVASR
ncbi:MAG: hypothetical protein U0797_09675 [Gemmataceae bacterium]